jgi:endoglucanase
MNRAALLKLAGQVLRLPTAPYHEHAVRDFVTGYCRQLGLPVASDKAGNLFIRYRHRVAGAPVVFVAHMDHPGFEALGPNRAQFLGGVPLELLKGARIRFGSVRANVRRVHRDKQLDIVADGPLRAGEPGMWDLPAFAVRGDRLQAVAIDDVLGVAAVLAALTDLVRANVPAHVWAVFTRAEEVGFPGAVTVARSGKIPRRALVVSVEMSKERPWARIGHGPVVRVGDRLSMFDPAATWHLETAARAGRIRLQRALMDGGTCEASAFAAFGYRVGGLCLPLGNYHNIGPGTRPRRENVSVADLNRLVGLIVQGARQWRGFGSLRQSLRRRVWQIYRRAPRRWGKL